LRTKIKEFEIVEIGVEGGVDRGYGTNGSLLPSVVYEGDLFYRSMLCKWTTSITNSMANETQV
jgi:hypothetical protein